MSSCRRYRYSRLTVCYVFLLTTVALAALAVTPDLREPAPVLFSPPRRPTNTRNSPLSLHPHHPLPDAVRSGEQKRTRGTSLQYHQSLLKVQAAASHSPQRSSARTSHNAQDAQRQRQYTYDPTSTRPDPGQDPESSDIRQWNLLSIQAAAGATAAALCYFVVSVN